MILFSLLASYIMVSQKADFNGETLVFNGSFSLAHELGDLKAGKATLTHPPLKKGNRKTPTLLLENHIEIEIRDQNTPFSITAEKAFCELSPQSPLAIWDVQFIELIDRVYLSQPNGPSASGGHAIYKKGFATLYPAAPLLRCALQLGADRIDAKHVTFNLASGELSCKEPIGALSQSPVRFSSNEMIWHRLQNQIVFNGQVHIEHLEQMTAEADSALLTYPTEFEFDSFSLKGAVRLLSTRIDGKESFALADALFYNPKNRVLILTADSPKKVLFWQEDVRLSASEVHIQRDPKTGKESVQGVGDVHFAFDYEEENAFHNFFKNLL